MRHDGTAWNISLWSGMALVRAREVPEVEGRKEVMLEKEIREFVSEVGNQRQQKRGH